MFRQHYIGCGVVVIPLEMTPPVQLISQGLQTGSQGLQTGSQGAQQAGSQGLQEPRTVPETTGDETTGEVFDVRYTFSVL